MGTPIRNQLVASWGMRTAPTMWSILVQISVLGSFRWSMVQWVTWLYLVQMGDACDFDRSFKHQKLWFHGIFHGRKHLDLLSRWFADFPNRKSPRKSIHHLQGIDDLGLILRVMGNLNSSWESLGNQGAIPRRSDVGFVRFLLNDIPLQLLWPEAKKSGHNSYNSGDRSL